MREDIHREETHLKFLRLKRATIARPTRRIAIIK